MMTEAVASYVVAGKHAWNRSVFDEKISSLPGEWHFASTPDDLDEAFLARVAPRYIFFVHWSDKVPDWLLQTYECVCFHMTDVPYGRGGSPLQNLIVRGHDSTKLTALRMASEFDAGPVYTKRPFRLDGRAEDIYVRMSELAAGMIAEIIEREPKPVPQVGDVTVFKRRKPANSELGAQSTVREVYDAIRMVDADTYPQAFLTHGGFRYEFSHARVVKDKVVAEVSITRTQEEAI